MPDTVTLYTAGRMQEIEDGTVVDGDVVGDNLLLKRRDGVTIDAGSVRGPQGVPGPAGGPGDVAPTANTWAIRAANGQVRTGTPSLADAAIPKSYFDGIVKGTELGAGVDLNNYRTPGIYHQSDNADATIALHYPTVWAGVLEVFANPAGQAAGEMVYQRYIPHGDQGGLFYQRIFWIDAWYPWKMYREYEDTGWVNVPTSAYEPGFSNDPSGNGTPLAYRIINDTEMWWKGRVITPSVAPNVTTVIATLPDPAPTPARLNNSSAIFTTGAFVAWVNYGNTRVLNFHLKSPWTTATATLDLTGFKILLT